MLMSTQQWTPQMHLLKFNTASSTFPSQPSEDQKQAVENSAFSKCCDICQMSHDCFCRDLKGHLRSNRDFKETVGGNWGCDVLSTFSANHKRGGFEGGTWNLHSLLMLRSSHSGIFYSLPQGDEDHPLIRRHVPWQAFT